MTTNPEPIPVETALQAQFIRAIQRRTPRVWATYWLIGLCAAVYFAMVFAGVDPLRPRTLQLVDWGANVGVLTFGQGQVWRLLTSVFVHAGIMHIGMNLYVLWKIGPFVERLCGNLRFIVLYLLCGIAGSVLSALFHAHTPSVGASGAIFGLYGVLLGFTLRHRHMLPRTLVASFQRSGGMFVLYNLIFSLAIQGVDLSAHVGGLVGGFLLGLIAVPEPTL